MAFTPPTLSSETIAHIGSFEIRNTLINSWIAVVFLAMVAFAFFKKGGALVPKGLQNFIGAVIELLFDFFNSVTQDPKQTKKFFQIVATIFIFVITANWMGIFPGVGPIGIYEEHEGAEILVPFFRSAYSDVNLTLALALISVVMTQIFGMASLGFFHYAGKFFVNPLKDPIGCFIGILELISETAKLISFSFRLFGNIFAGEVLLTVMGFLMPFIAPLPFYGLEIFVGFVQALVFAILTLVFMKIAVTSHHDPSTSSG